MKIPNQTKSILLIVISVLVMSCKDTTVEKNPVQQPDYTKEERLELFLESPITLKTSATEQRLNTIQFYKSYILTKSLWTKVP